MRKNLVFFGSPQLSADILESLLDRQDINLVGVVTAPDKPTGRHREISATPVANLSAIHHLPTFKPLKLDSANLSHLKLLKPDIFLVVSYGKIIPADWLNTPQIGTFNIHFSLLPRYRGALCLSEAIRNQEKETGVTLMKMDELMDHGPIIAQAKINLTDTDDTATLNNKLTHLAIELLEQKLPEICAQTFTLEAQDENLATFTPSHKTRTRDSAFIPFSQITSAQEGQEGSSINALIRSLNPDPGAWTTIGDQTVKIIRTHLEDDKLVIDLVQTPGKSPISWKQYLAGHKISL